MSNQPFHNKWHGFNHYTLPMSGYPDSATDPIASDQYPFYGTYYNAFTARNNVYTLLGVTVDLRGKGYTKQPSALWLPSNSKSTVLKDPVVYFNLDPDRDEIESVNIIDGGSFEGDITLSVVSDPSDTVVENAVCSIVKQPDYYKSNSEHYAFSYNLTNVFSADWSLFPSVESTVTTLSGSWNHGFSGSTALFSASGYYESYYTTVKNISSEVNYDGKGGTGWHIALSSITWRTNVSAVNIAQKVALPVKLNENSDRTIYWDTHYQTVYVAATGNYTMALDKIFNAKLGGKYTMWLKVDRCPEQFTNIVFNPTIFEISLKTPGKNYLTLTDVMSLSRNTITKIDFVYNGQKMLGRATQYYLDALTTDDIYYQGTGITMRHPISQKQKSPAFVNDYGPNIGTSRYLEPRIAVLNNAGTRFNRSGISINYVNLTQYPSVTSLYIAGSGINIKYFESNQYYFSYQIFGSSWPTQSTINRTPYLSGSFDRVIGSLSGTSNWQDSRFSQNLVVTPLRSTAPITIDNALPPPYELQTSNIIPVTSCTLAYKVSVISGKDKIIRSINVNNTTVSKQPIRFDGYSQQYNFLNEETAVLEFYRIQNDYDIKINFSFQPGRYIKNNYLWLNPSDNTLLTGQTLPTIAVKTRQLNKLYSNVDGNMFIAESNGIPNPSFSPALILSGSHRYLRYGPGKYSTSSTDLTGLSGLRYFNSFTAFTVMKITNTPPSNSILWWIGDYYKQGTANMGYGLVMGSDNKLYTRSEVTSLTVPVDTVIKNKPLVVTTRVSKSGNANARELVLVDNVIKLNRLTITNTNTYSLTNLKLNFNINPDKQIATSKNTFHLYEYYIFNRELTIEEIRRMNLFLMDKASKY